MYHFINPSEVDMFEVNMRDHEATVKTTKTFKDFLLALTFLKTFFWKRPKQKKPK